jgi:hypothetical protein
MKNIAIRLIIVILSFLTFNCEAQSTRKWEDIDTTGFFKKETHTRKGLTLILINKDSFFNPQTINRLKETFWEVYPKLRKRFNKKSATSITVVISDEYGPVAATLNGIIKINNQWMTNHPEDIDVITHELMHVVQEYSYQVPDNWLTDGIADYARFAFGVNNEKSGWTLTPYQHGHSYKNTYRIAARFLVWVEKRNGPKVIAQINQALRTETYSTAIWIKLTGKELDALWLEYSQNPNI